MSFGFADVVLGFVNSGAGPIDDVPYGGTFPGDFPVEVSLDVVLGDDAGDTVDFLSLPIGSELIVGFLDEVIVDGPGDDVFITEVGAFGEMADVFVSGGGAFVKLGTSGAGEIASFDLSDIGWIGPVTKVKIVSLENGGSSPGFDVVNVRALTAAAVDLDEDNEIDGSDQRDDLDLRGGDDAFSGGKGNDSAKGGKGRDALSGGQGADDLEGGAGRDDLKGGSGRDTLSGDAGRDLLDGGRGRDLIDGGRGDDRLKGGADRDRFRFERKDGDDVIVDFEKGDRLDLSDHAAAKGFRGLLRDVRDTGKGARIDVGPDEILLRGVDAEDLTRGDFIL
ncbi:MAG: hypothetical protein AAF763_12370 [Pseudomonadota bacterium]